MSDFRAMLASTHFNVSESFFPNINLQDGLNWAEEFIQNVVLSAIAGSGCYAFPCGVRHGSRYVACAGISLQSSHYFP